MYVTVLSVVVVAVVAMRAADGSPEAGEVISESGEVIRHRGRQTHGRY